MAITTLAGLKAALPGKPQFVNCATISTVIGQWPSSLWKQKTGPNGLVVGATPATGDGAVPTSATAGAIPFGGNPAGGNKKYLARWNHGPVFANRRWMIYDRLWHNSGFVGNVTTLQSIATPPTLTRYTTGAGVELWLCLYSIWGATDSTITAIYTNQDGTGGRTATLVKGANAGATDTLYPFQLQSGDSGVRSVASIQLSASTGTAGNLGLILAHKIAEVGDLNGITGITLADEPKEYDAFALGLPEIMSDACLDIFCSSAGFGSASSTGAAMSQMDFVEG